MAFILWPALALIPLLMGKGILRVLYGRCKSDNMTWKDAYLTGFMVLIGLAEAAHLTAVFLKWSFSKAVNMFAVLMVAVCLLTILLYLINLFINKTKKLSDKEQSDFSNPTSTHQILLILFGFSVLLQVIILITGENIDRVGDITLETVQSFLASDAIYQINPLTGQAYQFGIPLRLEVLALPTLYGSLSKLFAVSPDMVVERMIPVMVLIAGYLAYSSLAEVLFNKKDKNSKVIFLILVSLLLWLGDYNIFMDGFGVLHGGYRGTAIRGLVLLPYTICMCLQGRWKSVILCILAEACIVWTLYGMGACFMVTLLLLAVKLWMQKRGTEWNN